ncbi:Flp family type IVb pilin [Sphingomonas alpina]|uniref:Flp family type IVb pilin n=1 Tax=Sphingomonas alpina TaxID=653931 RepID=A0A7H0LP16_9SPHN|nr:Flp family type IVb pilin [Sphingomonas alpina]QNQ11419.1 Flp family type IVb pilin [Sphingomonas alpina]
MIMSAIKRLAGNRKGGTAIEYGLIAALVVITMIAAFVEVANTTTGMWGNVNNKMENARAN